MITAKILLISLLQTAGITGLSVDTTEIDTEQAYCLAQNVYHEARGEEIGGQFAVASVTLNRANDSRFPNTVCEVVQQTAISRVTNKIVCAFSWYCENNQRGKEIPVMNRDGTINQKVIDQFKTAAVVAVTVLNGEAEDKTHGATHFHNPYISQPAWRLTMKKTISIGNHIFYK